VVGFWRMGEAAILVEGMKKSFGEVHALKGIDFEVPPRTVFGLLGPDGAGKNTADLARNILVVALIAGVGFAVGFRFRTNVWLFLCALALVVLWSYALSGVFTLVAFWMKGPETTQAASFVIIAPLFFAFSAFVPVKTMTTWLKGFATNQPVSVTVSAARALCLRGPTASFLAQSLAWCIGIILACAPLAVWYYCRGL
jgi:ABC-type multidrug transport system permease subunit